MALIFIIDNNEAVRSSAAAYLRLSDHEVFEFACFEGVREAMVARNPALLLLDVVLPDGDGFAFTKEIRQKTDIPLIFVTDRGSESDRITGFEVGGDDYIVKPFSSKELVLRVAALLKRTGTPSSRRKVQDWRLDGRVLSTDEASHKAMLDQEFLKLTAAEWKILLYLSSNRGAVVSREQILDRCLAYSFEGYDRTVDTHIKNLRAKLQNPGWIETVRGYGYRFAGKEE